MRVLGFMTGTSLDAVDMAVLETDGEAIQGFGPAGEKKLDPAVRALLEAAIDALRLKWPGDPIPASFAPAAAAVAAEHVAAGRGVHARARHPAGRPRPDRAAGPDGAARAAGA